MNQWERGLFMDAGSCLRQMGKWAFYRCWIIDFVNGEAGLLTDAEYL